MHGRVGWQEGGMGGVGGVRCTQPRWRRLWAMRVLIAGSIVAACLGETAAGDGSGDRLPPKGRLSLEDSLSRGSLPRLSAASRAVLQARGGSVIPEDAAGLPFLAPGGVGRGVPVGAGALEGAPKTSVVFDWERPGCAMLLPVVEGESGTRVTGRVVNTPYQGDVEWENQGGLVAMEGKMELGFRETCPQGARELPGFLNKAKFLSENDEGVIVHPTFGGVIHGNENDVTFEIKNWRMSALSSSPLRVANDQFGLAVSLALDQTTLVIHNGTEDKSWDISRLRATAVGNGRVLEQDGEMRLKITNLPYMLDTDQLERRGRPPVRLILEFVSNITTRVDLPLDPPTTPGGNRTSTIGQGVNGTASTDAQAVSGSEVSVQNFTEGPVLFLSERDLTLAATTMVAPVFALAVLGMVLTLATFWHLPTLRACLTPLDKKLLRQVTGAMERGVSMGSFVGGRVRGTTDIGGGAPWTAKTPRTSFDMGASTVDMDVGRSTIVGTSISRGSLTFQELMCSVPVRRSASGAKNRWGEFDKAAVVRRGPFQYKVILQPCSGTLRGGEITGVLGPAGSGKKALLRILAGDLKDMDKDAVVRGSVFTLGSGSQNSKVNVGLVTGQSETLKSMTVAEAMVYAALLKSKPGTELTLIKQRILMASEELQLTPLMSRFVSGGKGLDGAERRRLMIACELQLDPDILMIEEPTAGLSAPDATNVIKSLRQVSRFGRAVLVSLSQPSNDLLASLDNTMLIGRGHVVFNGPTSDAYRFFASAACPPPKRSAFLQHAMKALSGPSTLTKLIQAAGRKEHHLQGRDLMPALSFKVVDQNSCRRKADHDPTSKLKTCGPYTSVPAVQDKADGACRGQAPKLSPCAGGAIRGGTIGGDGLLQAKGAQSGREQTDMAEESDPSYTRYDAVDACAHLRHISNVSSQSSPFAGFELNNGLVWQSSRKSLDSASDSSDLPLDSSRAAGSPEDGRREARLCSALEMHTPWVRGVDRCDSGAALLSRSACPSSSTSPPARRTSSRFEELPTVVPPRDEPDERGRSSIDIDRGNPAPQLPVDDSSLSFDDDACKVQLDCQTSGDLIELVSMKSLKSDPPWRRTALPDVSGIPEAAGSSQAGQNLEDSAQFPWRPARKFPGRGRSMNPGVGLQPSSPLKIGQGPFGRPPIKPRVSPNGKGALGGGEPSSQAEAPLAVAPKGEACERAAQVHRRDTAMPMLGNEPSSTCLDGTQRNCRHLKEPPVKQSLSLEASLLFWRGLNHMYREMTMLTAHSLAALGMDDHSCKFMSSLLKFLVAPALKSACIRASL
ncbi:unnamed protein product [Ostreobium quekettii]|uniref:ABC transporter domain-containing protein n=1 Tax=Ostreobium quekettii TaxID=121088 RepID=A0A8S1ISH2_9CHLO|nr:unnamed protein product [Ostreobium quekettii]